MNAARIRSEALEKLAELRVVILEHIIKVSTLSHHSAVPHWQIEIRSFQKRLLRYHKGKGGKENFTQEILWEYIWEDQVDELPLGFIEDYNVKDLHLNIEDIKERIQQFIDGVLKNH